MASQHPYAPWRRLILVPCWIIQLLFLGFNLAIAAVRVAQLIRNDNDDDDDDSDDGDDRTSLAIGWVYIVFAGLCIILTITEIVLLLRHKLKPLVFLIMNVFKSSCWTALLIVSFCNRNTRSNVVSLVVNIILLLAFYIPLAHGAIIYRRNRKAAIYEPVNLKYASYTSTEPFPEPFPHSYKSFATVEQTNTEPFPEAFPHAYKSFTTIEQTTELEANDHGAGRPRRLSYNHKRDTRFDSYKQSRRSYSDPNVVDSTVASPTEAFSSKRSRSSTLSLPIPQVVVHDHDEFMEMNKRAELS